MLVIEIFFFGGGAGNNNCTNFYSVFRMVNYKFNIKDKFTLDSYLYLIKYNKLLECVTWHFFLAIEINNNTKS